jgi:3-hydroxybutyryl-CoA dehydrogenase
MPMDILIVGNEENEKECREKLGESHTYKRIDAKEIRKDSKPGSIVFDFEPRDISVYHELGLTVFLNSVTTTLVALTSGKQIKATVFGFCGLPTFLNREILEVTVLNEESKFQLEQVCSQLNTTYKIVDDKVGMITPRIIGMIINEAYFTIEGEVASRKDIDLAMKLGTNYPFGPFEWCERIGKATVYGLLKAVYEDTKDERYKISALLESEANSIHAK